MKSRLILSLLALVLVAALAHGPTLKALPALEPATQAAARPSLGAFWTSPDGPYQPLAQTLLALEQKAGPSALLWTSLGLHTAAALAIFLLLRRVHPAAALLAALLLAAHPLFVSFIAAAPAQPALLAGVLMLLSLWAYAAATGDAHTVRGLPFTACLLLLGAALLAHPVACILPLLLFVPPLRPRAGLLVPVLLLALAAAWLALEMPQHTPTIDHPGAWTLATRLARALVEPARFVDLTQAAPLALLPAYLAALGALSAGALGATRLTALVEKEDRWIAAAAAVPVLVVLGFFSFRQAAQDHRPPPSAAELAAARARTDDAAFHRQLRHFKDLLAKDSMDTAAYLGLGSLYVLHGDLQNAKDAFENGVNADWENGPLHSDLAAVALRLGDNFTAVQHAKEALRLNPNDVQANQTMGDLTRGVHIDEALGYYAKALAGKPGDSEVLNGWGIALMVNNRLEEAEARFRQIIRGDPNNSAAHNNLGYVLQLLGRGDEALHEYQTALRLNPADVGMHYNLAGLFAAHKQERSAIEEYRIALAGKPNWPDAEDRLAYLLATAQEPKLRDAIEALRLAEHAALEARRQDKAAAETLAAIPIHTPPSLRPEALEQAGALRHDTQRQETQVLEVLAALQAYAGHFDQAARTAAEAAQVAQDACLTDLAATLAEEVRFYNAQQPATLAPQTQPLSRMPEGLSR